MKTASPASKCKHPNHQADVWYDDGRKLKIDINCTVCGYKVCTIRAIRNEHNPLHSSCCIKFADGTYYCGDMPVGERMDV